MINQIRFILAFINFPSQVRAEIMLAKELIKVSINTRLPCTIEKALCIGKYPVQQQIPCTLSCLNLSVICLMVPRGDVGIHPPTK